MSGPLKNPFITEPDYFERRIRGMWISGQGREFHTHGEQGGTQGIWNQQGQVAGIWDSPVKTTWKSSAFEDGSTQKSVKRTHRDMQLGFHCIPTPGRGAEENEAEFRQIFDYEVDEWDDNPEPITLHMDTDMSGERRLDLLMYEEPELDPPIDPIKLQYFDLTLKVRAGQPDWYEDDVITQFPEPDDPQYGETEASGFIEVSNPTDRPMRHKIILTRASWQVPDVSWKGGKGHRRPGGAFSNRIIPLQPITEIQGGVVISLNGKDLMVRDHNFTNALPALLPNGQHFMHVIPPYTPKTLLPISYTGAPAGIGAVAKLVQPRRWSRPWGQELR